MKNLWHFYVRLDVSLLFANIEINKTDFNWYLSTFPKTVQLLYIFNSLFAIKFDPVGHSFALFCFIYDIETKSWLINFNQLVKSVGLSNAPDCFDDNIIIISSLQIQLIDWQSDWLRVKFQPLRFPPFHTTNQSAESKYLLLLLWNIHSDCYYFITVQGYRESK